MLAGLNSSGLGHSAPANNGKPEIIARELKLFFKDSEIVN